MPADWSNYSDSNIKKAECEKQASVTLRSVISGVVEQTRNDLLTQCRNVDLALKKRVEECTNAKERLTGHLDKVMCTSVIIFAYQRCKYIRNSTSNPNNIGSLF